MKRIFILLLIFSATVVYSQSTRESGAVTNMQQRNDRALRLQREKVAFFTLEIDLSPREAEIFWPIYNEFWREKETAYQETQQIYRKILDHLEGKRRVSENELKQLLERYIEGSSREYAIQKKYIVQFEAILPINKVVRIYKAEEDFRMKMIEDLRRGGGTVIFRRP